MVSWSGKLALWFCGRLEPGKSVPSHSSASASEGPGRGRQGAVPAWYTGPTSVVDIHAAEPAGVPGYGQSAAATPHTGKPRLTLQACGSPGGRAAEGLCSDGKDRGPALLTPKPLGHVAGSGPRLRRLRGSCGPNRLRLCSLPGTEGALGDVGQQQCRPSRTPGAAVLHQQGHPRLPGTPGGAGAAGHPGW